MRPWIFAAAAVLAAGVFWIAATTYPAPTESVFVPGNRVSTGALHLDLSDGSARTDLTVTDLLPGDTQVQRFWIAGNDAGSATAGVLSLRFDQVRDVAAPCAVSRDKALAEQASGINGCSVTESGVTGRPEQGNLSRVLSVELRRGTTAGSTDCSAGGGDDVVVRGESGNLRSFARRSVTTGRESDLVLVPGQGACFTVAIGWPPSVTAPAAADRNHPLDNAAQGDSLHVRAVFTLMQVAS